MIAHRDEGGPAYPCVITERVSEDHVVTNAYAGMSLRDWFAGQVMAALVARAEFDAVMAYKFADAMLRARAT